MNKFFDKAIRPVKKIPALIWQRYFEDFVFIHINKTGGTSIEKALGVHFEHRTAQEKVKELGRSRWDKKYTFAFIRNPWDKVVSHYHYRIKNNQTNLGNNPIGFSEWVKRAYGEQDPMYYNNPKMFMPQSDWVIDGRGEIIVNFIGRFEKLEEDFNTVCKSINKQATLPHIKSSKRTDYRDYYDDESLKIITDWFREDIKRFEYTFDPK